MGDPLNYLLELGFTLDEVETLKSRNDFTCQQMSDAAKAIVDRGGNPLEAFGPRATGWEKPIPFDEIQTPDFPVEALSGPLGGLCGVPGREHTDPGGNGRHVIARRAGNGISEKI